MTNPASIDQEIAKLLDVTRELVELNKLDEAEKFLDEILKYKPDDLNVSFQRGTILMKRGEPEKALEHFLRVYDKVPDFVDLLNKVASVYFSLKKFGDAISYCQKSLSIKPDSDSVIALLAACHYRRGDVEESIKCFRRAIEISPQNTHVHSDLILTMTYAESILPDQLTAEAKNFGKNIEKYFPEKTEFSNDKNKERLIRIGYISPDFRDHPVPYFLEPLLRYHDRDKFQIYAYSNTFLDNPILDRMKTRVDFWRDVRNLDVEKIYDTIVQDKIDILVDVTGHTAYNNLKVFARRAAPIQITWLGYPGTTGVKSMDYRITDFYADPPGMTEHLNTETLCRLSHMFCVYAPHDNSPDVIDHPPFEDNGHITFGCFNNFIKVRDPVLAAWGDIMRQVPGSKLLLEIENIEDPQFLKKIQTRIERQNISLDRVILEPRKRSNQFVLYNKIDIALDPFPCTGGTTSIDTLWMGVPFVTLAGIHFSSRMGVSILSNAGMPDLIAQNIDEYISIAVSLAKDTKRLKKFRDNLRGRLAMSPVMDQEAFVQELEVAYRGMWRRYCD